MKSVLCSHSPAFNYIASCRTDPTNTGSFYYGDTGPDSRGIWISDDYAYVATQGGLSIIDVSDPTNPGTPVSEPTGNFARDVYISGDYAYLSNFDDGIAIIDISDPTNPGSPIFEDTDGHAFGVFVSGDYIYVGDQENSLAIIDISDPTNPGTPVYENTTGTSWGVYVDGEFAYVADYESGLAVIDISDPTNPGEPVYVDISNTPYGVFVSENYAYLAGNNGLTIIQISPIIINSSSDLTVESDYTEQIISWTATDSIPSFYSIKLNNSEIVVESAVWTSGHAITYSIPDGFDIGTYIYTVNFTDYYGKSITDTIMFTVEESGIGIGTILLISGGVVAVGAVGAVTTVVIVKKKKPNSNLKDTSPNIEDSNTNVKFDF